MQQDGSLRIVSPTNSHEELFQQAHEGNFGGHLSDAKVYSELLRHYYWPKMQSDITHWSKGCLTCATYMHGKGHSVRSPLTPKPVAGPFDRVGIDIQAVEINIPWFLWII